MAPYIIITRQKAEPLVQPSEILGAGAVLVAPVRQVAGYAYLSILGISDQAFQVTIDEASTPDGPFVRTATFTSGADSAGQEQICERFFPCGSYVQVSLTNLGSQQTVLSFQVLGIPA